MISSSIRRKALTMSYVTADHLITHGASVGGEYRLSHTPAGKTQANDVHVGFKIEAINGQHYVLRGVALDQPMAGALVADRVNPDGSPIGMGQRIGLDKFGGQLAWRWAPAP